MRIGVQELTPGCDEWCACLFDKFGQPLVSAKSTVSANDAEDKLEEKIRDGIRATEALAPRRDKCWY